ncbi:FAD-dependent oxidoreductase [Undibacterium sp. SXout20W]|uniref:FAD-dependent oxidoreductase n=1 Tax=Undibacterium sp. SXout20W TaxID=3413051 RepID=UPI003BF0A7B3
MTLPQDKTKPRRDFLGRILLTLELVKFPMQLSQASNLKESQLSAAVNGLGSRLQPITPLKLSSGLSSRLKDPVFRGSEPSIVQMGGWLDAWTPKLGRWFVKAKSPQDIVHGIRFAIASKLPIAIRGGAHSYFGQSCKAESVVLWTAGMRDIKMQVNFRPAGAPDSDQPQHVVHVGSGCTWGEVYAEVIAKRGRYVQGGGCTTVGVGGMLQGGGFGSFSKGFGTVASNLLEAEIVTADGQIRIVNPYRDPELFWAIKGGGGGTFGVLTRVTLRTHDLPERFGVVRFKFQAKSDQKMEEASTYVLQLIREQLLTPYWGEKIVFMPDRIISVETMFQGISETQARDIWQPLVNTIEQYSDQYEILTPLFTSSVPSKDLWNSQVINQQFPGALSIGETRDGLNKSVFWTGDGEQAGLVWTAYESLWLDMRLLKQEKILELASTFAAASNFHSFELHLNKGLAGLGESMLALCNDTPVNPQSLTAFALMIVADGQVPLPGNEVTAKLTEKQIIDGHSDRDKVARVAQKFRQLAPDAGSYLNESNYFHPDIATAAWGENFPRLQAVKNQYDPTDLFHVHHGVRPTDGYSISIK